MHSSHRLTRVHAALALTMGAALASVLQPPSAQAAPTTDLVISEFRVRGPSGANDEFIEIANRGPADHTVAASSGTGYGVAASDGVTRCSIPNGTVIPRFGHYLCVNSVAYSLSSYPAGNGTTATGDATYTTDIPDNAGIALFDNNTGGASYDLAHRIDAVGATSVANTLYKEGAGYPALTPFSIDHSFYRNLSTSSITPIDLQTTTPGVPEDTDNNAADFVFVDANGTLAGAGQRLGAPGPENLTSPIGNGGLEVSLLDPCVSAQAAPNVVRGNTSDPANNSTFGTYEFRRTITNNTGGNVTRLRLRVADVRTFPAPSGIADMRVRTSSAAVVTVDRAPCGSGTSDITVHGTTLEQPPSQPNGGGFNSSLSIGVVTLANPLARGASVDVRLLAGLQQTGNNAVRIIAEAITAGTVTTPTLSCLGGRDGIDTDLCNRPPTAVDDGPTVTNEDTDLTVGARGVLSNDTDADGDPLTAELVSEPTHGTLTLSADGSYIYSPDSDYHGDDSFTYRTYDATSASSDTATVTIQVTSIDDPPTAHPTVSPEPNAAGWHDGDVTVEWNWTDDGAGIDPATCATHTTSEGQGAQTLTATCADPAGNETTAEHIVKVDTSAPTIRIDSPFHAWLYYPGDPGLIADYTCRDELSGIESCTGTVADGAPLDTTTGFQVFRVTARDGVGHEESAWVEVLVDTPPDAVDGSFTGPRDTELRDTLAGLASDADNDELEFQHATGPSHGTVSVNTDGTFRYRPDPGFVGVDTFRYRVLDRWLAEPAEVTITITDIADRGDPSVTVTSPTAGRYLQGSVVTADYACTDSDSGIAACTGNVADGARIDTARPGVHSFAVTARDRAGNDHTATVAYTVFVAPTCNGKPATIVGTAGVDVLTGTPGNDVIVAGDGRDWIAAGGGNDTICTGAARDVIRGGAGNDAVSAGPGRDILLGAVGKDTLSGSTGGDILVGGTGDDTLLGARGNDRLSGGGHTDSCRGGTGSDRATSCESILGIP